MSLEREVADIASLSGPAMVAAWEQAYVLADNKLALNAGWDREILAIELQGLIDLEFDVELTGFSLAEVDFVLDEAGEADPDGSDAPEDVVPEPAGPVVSQLGDVWELGRHRLVCGYARSAEHMALLMPTEVQIPSVRSFKARGSP